MQRYIPYTGDLSFMRGVYPLLGARRPVDRGQRQVDRAPWRVLSGLVGYWLSGGLAVGYELARRSQGTAVAILAQSTHWADALA